ncbi:MAG: hypothetical protein Q4E57_02040 [Eubacteriales bacterium]|nr:hypothetical protein [Eubacteriales bacterium]
MKKNLMAFICTAFLAALITVPSFAGQWKSDVNGWWWQNDDGSYPAGCWQTIDSTGSGTSMWYYFDNNGYLLTNTVTPDGYIVNGSGAWTVDGIVQTSSASVLDSIPVYGYTDNYTGIYDIFMDEYQVRYDIAYNSASKTIDLTVRDVYSNAVKYKDTYKYRGEYRGVQIFDIVSDIATGTLKFASPGELIYSSNVSVRRK